MSLDFHSFRLLLLQNALEDAIDMLSRQAPKEFQKSASRIESQLNSFRKSAGWNIFRPARKNKHHTNIVRNLYQSGLAASKGEPPPELIGVNPWLSIALLYGSILLVAGSGLFFLTHRPPCPVFEDGNEITIIVDKFSTAGQPFLQKIGLNKETLEKQISDQLRRENIAAKVHAVNIGNSTDAKKRCEECGAKMLIWGDVEYGDSVRAYLYHYLDHENYESYILNHNIPGVEEHYKNVFMLQTSQWIGNIQCLINLFQGLLAKEKFDHGEMSGKGKALAQVDSLFGELALCADDLVLKIFALQCKGWAEVKRNNDEEAIVTYNEILSLDSNNTLALNNSAVLYEKQENFLYAHARYEKLLEKNELPYLRLKNAAALTKLDRKVEAAKEVETVRKSDDYRARKATYDKEIRNLPTSAYVPGGTATDLSPSLTLSTIATQFNKGNTSAAVNTLDALSTQFDTTTFTREDAIIMNELYKTLGAREKSILLERKTTNLGWTIPEGTNVTFKATRKN